MESKKKKPARPALAKREKTYHHGDLAAALVEAAEAVLTERGVEGFTLRECARRAGVSHAAPAHHFGDARGLLSAVAALGFERLTEAQRVARANEPELKNILIAAGVAYVRFALSHPAQFQLMFQGGLLDRTNERLQAAGTAAFGIYVETYSAVTGQKIEASPDKSNEPGVLREWALVHGIATLAIQGQLGPNRGQAAMTRLLARARAVLESALQNAARGKL